MTASTTIAEAIAALRDHLLRSVLTVLGIVIGVWSVVTMVTLADATSGEITRSISALGSNTMIISPSRGSGRGEAGSAGPPFRDEELRAIREDVDGIAGVVPQVTTQRTVVMNAANWQTTVTGTSDAYLTVQRWPLAEGRRFSSEEEAAGATVCLLGDTVRQKLSPGIAVEGESIRVGEVSCTVIGVLAPKGQGFGSNPDDSVLMPIRAVQRDLTGRREVDVILIAYDARRDGERLKQDLSATLRRVRLVQPGEEDDFSIFDARQIADTVSSTSRLLTALLGTIAAVSLVVGGIGIMNIMLVSVTERTREIGIRLAVGALPRDVLSQFLVEAVVLCCLGGLIGLGLALVTTAVLSPVIGVGFAFDPGVNLLAFGLSAGIGMVFGYVPARKAAGLSPIEALRHD